MQQQRVDPRAFGWLIGIGCAFYVLWIWHDTGHMPNPTHYPWYKAVPMIVGYGVLIYFGWAVACFFVVLYFASWLL